MFSICVTLRWCEQQLKTKMLLLKYCIGRRCQARHDITGVPILDVFDPPDALGTEKLQLEPWEYAEAWSVCQT